MEIIRNRTIRPSVRNKKSTVYKIDTRKVTGADTLLVNINHESKPFFETHVFHGSDLDQKDSIHFSVLETTTKIQIHWAGVVPKNVRQFYSKNSFAPFSDSETRILILGTIPGDKSLELNEYYGHPQNRFWRAIAFITEQELPVNYDDKKALLLRSGIGLWDVAHRADRKGSLDSAIKDEEPNDLNTLISDLKKLKIIGFNGKTAEKLYDKYFDRKAGIHYFSLPSSSPANAGTSLRVLCEKWKQMLITNVH
jgi:hypoxanthine-DNA glycosylase